MILYVEYAKHSIEKLLEIISEFNKAVGYKTNIQKSVVFYKTRERRSWGQVSREQWLDYLESLGP